MPKTTLQIILLLTLVTVFISMSVLVKAIGKEEDENGATHVKLFKVRKLAVGMLLVALIATEVETSVILVLQ